MNAEATNTEEESMEDILHSIRDIIADSPNEKAADDATGAEDEDEEEILELTDVVAPEENSNNAEDAITEEPEEKSDDPTDILADIDEALDEEEELNEQLSAATEEPIEDNNTAEEIVEPAEESPSIPEPAAAEAQHHDDINSLISGDAANKAGSTIKNLINTLPKNEIDSPVTRTGTTLEDLVVEAIKPMLSDWLDQNLPTMVERIVKHEIKKLIKEEIDA